MNHESAGCGVRNKQIWGSDRQEIRQNSQLTMHPGVNRWVWLSGGQPLMGPQMGVPPVPLPELTQQWRHGKLSNMEYLLHLNRLAGRRAGSQALHPLLPWVLDMSAPPEPAMHEVLRSTTRWYWWLGASVIYVPRYDEGGGNQRNGSEA